MKLKEFLDKYGTHTTSNFQLLHWGKQLKLKNFRVVMKDEIKDIDSSKPVLNLITNIQNFDEPSAHWSAFHKGTEFAAFDKVFKHFWYDSYGRPDEEIIKRFGQGSIIASDDQNQKFGTTYCGQLALYFLYHINNDGTLEEIISELKNANRYLI